MPERLANLGYFAVKKEVVKGTPLIPNVYVPIYDESFMTDVALHDDNPIVGNKAARFQAIQGMRNHQGDATVLAEPNIAGYLLDMLYTKGTTTGANPYTHPFTPSVATNPNSYTVDIAKGQVVHRFMGLELSELGIDFDDNKMLFKIKGSALKSLIVREVSSVTTNVVTLKTNYDDVPTDGFVATDLVRVMKASDNTVQDFTVSSVTGTTVTLSGSPTGIVAGDFIFLRPATPSFTLRNPFLWSKTEFRFADTAANALTAAQTRVDDGSNYTLKHMFQNDEGEQRSGDFDPASLARTQVDGEINVKKFFDNPDDANRFLTNTKRALVVRHFSEDTTYELRTTFNNIKLSENPTSLNTSEIVYSESKFLPQYDNTDAAVFDIKVINAVVTI